MGRRPTTTSSSAAAAEGGLRKGAWNIEEDIKLMAYITKYGSWNWRQLPKFAGLKRCGKSCRLRWMNYLNPDIKRGNYTKEEEDTIIRLHESLGNKWSLIAAQLPGRTDNEIKNHWHGKLKKMLKKAPSFEKMPEITSNSSVNVNVDYMSTSKNLSDLVIENTPAEDSISSNLEGLGEGIYSVRGDLGKDQFVVDSEYNYGGMNDDYMSTSKSLSDLVIEYMPAEDSISSNLEGLGEEIYSVGGDLGKDQFVVDSVYSYAGLNDDYFQYAESYAAAADFGYEGFLTFPSSYDLPIAGEDEFFLPLWL